MKSPSSRPDAAIGGANRFVRERARKQWAKARARLSELLGNVNQEAFVQLAWAVNALQSGQAAAARGVISYPAEAATTERGARMRVHEWEIETLVNELLTVRRATLPPGPNLVLNCGMFGAMGAVVDQLRALENADSGVVLGRMSVLTELHRISQRQFEWQRGFANAAQMYRWAFVFGGPVCTGYFEATHGLTINEFTLTGFAMFASFKNGPAFNRQTDLTGVGVSAAAWDATVRMTSATLQEARQRAAMLRLQQRSVAYEPSVLRQNPILAFGEQGERLRAPLPELIVVRATEGIYYDVVHGPPEVRNEIGRRFELYAGDLFRSVADLNVAESYTYRLRGNNVDTPDLLLRVRADLTLPVECKAKRMTIQAKFGENPIAEASAGYDEIAKGVFQLWRFFSHARRGLHNEPVAQAPAGLVLTLDSWLSMAGVLRDEVVKRAEAMAARDPEITAEDRKPVVFCSIEDLEQTLRASDAAEFQRAFTAAATSEEYTGWALPNVLERVREREIENPFPFNERMGEVMPWWAVIEQRRPERRARA